MELKCPICNTKVEFDYSNHYINWDCPGCQLSAGAWKDEQDAIDFIKSIPVRPSEESVDLDILNTDEAIVMEHLVNAWNAYTKLNMQHTDDKEEFRHSMHRLQHLLMIRPTRRNSPSYYGLSESNSPVKPGSH